MGKNSGCPDCKSNIIKKNGFSKTEKQMYKCKNCGRNFRDNPTPHRYPLEFQKEIYRLYQQTGSVREVSRLLGISRNTATKYIQLLKEKEEK
jgi:transposase-like protein